jgi:hypothetical protein
MKKILCAAAVITFLQFTICSSHAGFFDKLLGGGASTNSSSVSSAVSALSQDQVATALKEALGNGLQLAVSTLGHNDGFLTNLEVKIPLPQKLQSAEKMLHALKQDELVDDFVATMNHAAEQAVPQAASVFGDAVKQMSIDDAKNILTGPDDAATQFFRRTTQTNLYARFLPIVQAATAKTGVTSAYKKMMGEVNSSKTFGSLTTRYLGSDALDIDAYVTNKSLDSLFKMVADEEKNIRQNPAARTTDLLQKVFSAVKS